MPRPMSEAGAAADPLAAFWSLPVPAAAAGRQTRLVRAWESPAESWRNPRPRVADAPAVLAPPPHASEALDQAQQRLVSAGRPSIAAYARFGARAVR
jgi:hypothetical protein